MMFSTKRSLFLTAGLLAVSFNASPMVDAGKKALSDVSDTVKAVWSDITASEYAKWSGQKLSDAKGVASEYANLAGQKLADTSVRSVAGWNKLSDKLSDTIAPDIAVFKNIDWKRNWEFVRDLGLDNSQTQSPCFPASKCFQLQNYPGPECLPVSQPYYYVVQGTKIAGAAVLILAGAWAAYKVGKLSWRGLCALKNALWTNRSKIGKAAAMTGLTALGTAVAVAPGIAVQYGYLQ